MTKYNIIHNNTNSTNYNNKVIIPNLTNKSFILFGIYLQLYNYYRACVMLFRLLLLSCVICIIIILLLLLLLLF